MALIHVADLVAAEDLVFLSADGLDFLHGHVVFHRPERLLRAIMSLLSTGGRSRRNGEGKHDTGELHFRGLKNWLE